MRQQKSYLLPGPTRILLVTTNNKANAQKISRLTSAIGCFLNQSEQEELQDIKSKYALEKFLREKGIDADEFYQKLFEQKNSEAIQSRLDFLKNDN